MIFVRSCHQHPTTNQAWRLLLKNLWSGFVDSVRGKKRLHALYYNARNPITRITGFVLSPSNLYRIIRTKQSPPPTPAHQNQTDCVLLPNSLFVFVTKILHTISSYKTCQELCLSTVLINEKVLKCSKRNTLLYY